MKVAKPRAHPEVYIPNFTKYVKRKDDEYWYFTINDTKRLVLILNETSFNFKINYYDIYVISNRGGTNWIISQIIRSEYIGNIKNMIATL
jgi:hypothetical protein